MKHTATKIIRPIAETLKPKNVTDGAGVRLNRVFGYHQTPRFDPFLLLDHFKSDNPSDYIAGFPWHPHRGIETVTYMIRGSVEHKDSLKNSGIISSGDVQWMTAGSGIIHQEMPQMDENGIEGFQLWVNLPKDSKMMAPRYQELKASEIPIIRLENNCVVKVICGEFESLVGPIKDVMASPMYLDISVPENTLFETDLPKEMNIFAYVFEGNGKFYGHDENIYEKTLCRLEDGDMISVKTGDSPMRFLLVGGSPLNEPIAWGGPIVMNTKEELDRAFYEYEHDKFIK